MKNNLNSSIRSTVLNYLPGFIVLIFSMLALYFSVLLTEEHESLIGLHLDEHHRIYSNSSYLYWSVIASGFAGFILVLLNSDKLFKIKRMYNSEKETARLLEERLAALEATQEGIFISDEKGKVTYLNDTFLANAGYVGLDRKSFLGKHWSELFVNSDLGEEFTHILNYTGEYNSETVPKKIVTRFEVPNENVEVGTIYAELSVGSIEQGGLVGILRDRTEYVTADFEREELQKQFFQAQKMEAIGRMAGGIAHDFNNILAAINGYAEFLSEDIDEELPQHKFSVNILNAVGQAKGLIRQILAFSRRNDEILNNFDLINSLSDCIKMLRAMLPKYIDVGEDISLDSAIVYGNSSQVSQVIMNLFVNALDAIEGTDRKESFIKVGLHSVNSSDYTVLNAQNVSEDKAESNVEAILIKIENINSETTRLAFGNLYENKKYVCLSIEDTGCGMTRATMEKIFEPFFTTKPVDKGTGLGLATTHGVIAEHHAAMLIHSTIGRGTLFQLFFPLSDVDEEYSQTNKVDNYVHSGDGYILLVDDQQDARDVTQIMLERMGYQVGVVEGPMEALDFLKDNSDKIDLVITDYNMPKMNGVEFIKESQFYYPNMPFILLSGYSEHKIMDTINDLDMVVDIIKKPVSSKVLSQKLSSFFHGKKMA